MQRRTNEIIGLFLTAAAGFNLACQTPGGNTATANTAANANAATRGNVNAINANVANANTSAATSGATIETKEPEQYQATVALKLEMSGAASNNPAIPPITANVARSGADRRMEFALPTGEKLIYLDRGGKQFVVSPNRKQYAELNKESLGFEVRRFLMPEQIVNQVRNLKGVEQVGEETVNGRPAVRYRYGSTTETKSQAGTVSTESIVLVDKETTLPLRSSTVAQSQNGNVQGVQGISFVTEMSNIQTVADPNLFAEPTDYKQVAPEEIKSQVNALFSAATLLMGQLLKSGQTPTAPTAPTP